MPFRRLLVAAVVLLAARGAGAQVTPDPLDRPTQLPPLLVPPADDPPPPPPMPRGPAGEYDHNFLYLPEYVPSRAPEACRPLGRWWVNPAVELGWLPTSAVARVRLRVPDGGGGTVPGPVLPVAGRTPGSFQPGFSLSVGRFLGDTNTHGIEGSLFTLGPAERTFYGFDRGAIVVFPQGTTKSAPQVFVLPPPFRHAVESFFPVTLSTWFVGADANYRQTLLCTPDGRLDALAGYRFAYLRDELYLGDVPDPGHDDFRRNRAAATNAFHGGQIGLAGEYRFERWYVGGTAKAAFGVVTSDVTATGMFAGAQGLTPAGYARLAALSDPGRTAFAVLPTVNVNVGRQLGEHARLFVGYSFQYLSRVTRLGGVLDPAAASAPVTDFWVQAMNFGVELRY